MDDGRAGALAAQELRQAGIEAGAQVGQRRHVARRGFVDSGRLAHAQHEAGVEPRVGGGRREVRVDAPDHGRIDAVGELGQTQAGVGRFEEPAQVRGGALAGAEVGRELRLDACEREDAVGLGVEQRVDTVEDGHGDGAKRETSTVVPHDRARRGTFP